MTDRTRRRFLALGAGLLGGAAGCLGGRERADAPATPSGPGDGTAGDGTGATASDRPAETGTALESVTAAASLAFDHADRLHRLDAPVPQRDVAAYYLALLSSGDHAAAFPTERFGNADARRFVDETDFSTAVVVVVQDRRSSSHPDLELREVGRAGTTVTIDARYPGEGGTADITTDTLLVRVATGGRSVEAARATVAPQFGDPDRFATANAYDATPEFDTPGALVARNRDCSERSLIATVSYEGDLFAREPLDLGPAASRRLEGVFARPGEWRVSLRTDGETVSESLSLSGDPPGDVLVGAAGDGSVSVAHRPDGVDDDPATDCETDGYPYESADPDENLADPVDLWALDRSESARRLQVTIRDGDTAVFSEEFETRDGYDKARRAGLLAKKTDYVVEATTDESGRITETVTVEDGVSKLTVRVSESGELTVALD